VGAAVCGLVVAVAAFLPYGGFVPASVWQMDDLAHGLGYAGLAGFIAWALRGEGLSRRNAMLISALVATAHGVSTELGQGLVPGRATELMDLVSDAVGSVLGAAVGAFVSRGVACADPTEPPETT
jgi:VanZ family protein